MRSRHVFTGLLALLPLFSCETKGDRLDDICVRLSECTGYVDPGRCRRELDDALRDRRVTATGLTRCAKCLRPPATDEREQSCSAILDERHCDIACNEVAFVLGARTCDSTAHGESVPIAGLCHTQRPLACDVWDTYCGLLPDDGDPLTTYPQSGMDADTCKVELARGYELDGGDSLLGTRMSTQAQVDHDREVAGCVACLIAQVPLPSPPPPYAGISGAPASGAGASAVGGQSASGAAGANASGGASAGASHKPSLTERQRAAFAHCPPLLEACGAPCSLVEPLASRLRQSAAALVYCDRVRGCNSSAEQPGVAGMAGNLGAGGASDGGNGAAGHGTAGLETAGEGGGKSHDGAASEDGFTCYQRVLGMVSPNSGTLVGCTDCAKQSLDCAALNASCRCERFQP